LLIGDPAKAQAKLNWQPSVTFEELVHLMVEADLQALGLATLGSASGLLDRATLRAGGGLGVAVG
jgi:GDPmannose 4,6-dehydratase